jgi:hypothetical protein
VILVENILLDFRIKGGCSMPELGPMGRGGARRRTRRRVNARNESESENEPSEVKEQSIGATDELDKLVKLLKDKGVISEEEYNLIFS